MKITGKNENGNFVAQSKRGNLWTVQVSGRYNSTFTMTDEQVRQLVIDSTRLHKPQDRVEKTRAKVKSFVYKMSALMKFNLDGKGGPISQIIGTIPVDEIATTTL